MQRWVKAWRFDSRIALVHQAEGHYCHSDSHDGMPKYIGKSIEEDMASWFWGRLCSWRSNHDWLGPQSEGGIVSFMQVDNIDMHTFNAKHRQCFLGCTRNAITSVNPRWLGPFDPIDSSTCPQWLRFDLLFTIQTEMFVIGRPHTTYTSRVPKLGSSRQESPICTRRSSCRCSYFRTTISQLWKAASGE